MTHNIHTSAIIGKKAKIGNNVTIGPFSIIGDNVEIGDNNIIKSHCVIDGYTKIGDNNTIFPFVAIGQEPQDLKFKDEKSRIEIGNNNKIREHTTIHPGTADDNLITKIGNNCLLMIASHVAHDCMIGNNVILANNATLAGHVKVGDHAIIGGLSAVHQFVRIGNNSMIGGMSAVENDVIPYGMVIGERARLAGVNIIGLKRAKFSRDEIHSLRSFYKELFNNVSSKSLEAEISELEPKYINKELVQDVIKFLNIKNSRAILKPKS